MMYMGGVFKYQASISLIVGLLLIKGSESISCYQCNSVTDLDCASLANGTVAKTYLKPCLDVHMNSGFCRKIVQHVKYVTGSTRVIRRCGWENNINNISCKSFEDDDHKEIVCQCFEDGCNAANNLITSFSLLLLLPLLPYIL